MLYVALYLLVGILVGCLIVRYYKYKDSDVSPEYINKLYTFVFLIFIVIWPIIIFAYIWRIIYLLVYFLVTTIRPKE